ncbi:MAG: YegS/Rv2252/BmrU family lipid kinase [Clostridia bacterium]|nr:YegS/Rv2252/BmrU family lipid kinase [Clostridia bacterium]
MKKLAFIYNPGTGKAKILQDIPEIIDIFVKHGFEPTVLPTQSRNFCADFIKNEGSRFDRIVVSGGDGTLHEAVNGLMAIDPSNRPPLGYIPAGTTNDFAASLSLELKFPAAAQQAAGANILPLDVGRFNDKYFSYVAAFGAFTSVAYDTPQSFKNVFGHAAYIIKGIQSISDIRPLEVTVTTDNFTETGKFIYGMASNTLSLAGVKAMNDTLVDLNDGLFECILIRQIKSVADLNSLIADLTSRNRESKHYLLLQSPKITFTSAEKIPWTLDGEFGGEETEVEIENMHSAINFVR